MFLFCFVLFCLLYCCFGLATKAMETSESKNDNINGGNDVVEFMNGLEISSKMNNNNNNNNSGNGLLNIDLNLGLNVPVSDRSEPGALISQCTPTNKEKEKTGGMDGMRLGGLRREIGSEQGREESISTREMTGSEDSDLRGWLNDDSSNNNANKSDSTNILRKTSKSAVGFARRVLSIKRDQRGAEPRRMPARINATSKKSKNGKKSRKRKEYSHTNSSMGMFCLFV